MPNNLLETATEVFYKIKETNPDCDLIALDWAGIGDAVCHSRLILHHLLPRKILWITTPTVYGLFKDDPLMDVRCGFDGPRGIGNPELGNKIDQIMKDVFKKETLPISKNIIRDFANCIARKHNFSDAFFCCCGMEKDKKIKHSLIHKGQSLIKTNKKYIVVENFFRAQTPALLSSYKKLFEKIKDRYDIVSLGAAIDPIMEGMIDCRGFSLYDSFSIVKNCSAFIGRSSGNQSLMCFLHQIPIIEMDVAVSASYQECGLHPDVKKVKLPEEAEKYL